MVDQTLVEKAFSGDEEANTILYELTFKKVFAIASRILKNYEDAMDYSQEAYLNALIHINELRDKSKFDTWLYQITARRCYRYYNEQKSRKKLYISDEEYREYLDTAQVSASDPARTFNPEEYAVSLDKKAVVSHLIDELPLNQKTCVIMHYYAELTISEIALALDIPEGTVKSNINYAKKKLKRMILANHKDYAYQNAAGNSVEFIINSSVTQPQFPMPPVRYIMMIKEKAMNAENKKGL